MTVEHCSFPILSLYSVSPIPCIRHFDIKNSTATWMTIFLLSFSGASEEPTWKESMEIFLRSSMISKRHLAIVAKSDSRPYLSYLIRLAIADKHEGRISFSSCPYGQFQAFLFKIQDISSSRLLSFSKIFASSVRWTKTHSTTTAGVQMDCFVSQIDN